MINIIDSFIQYIFIFRLGIPRKIGERRGKVFAINFHTKGRKQKYIFFFGVPFEQKKKIMCVRSEDVCLYLLAVIIKLFLTIFKCIFKDEGKKHL
jgi:hypothetical protein